MVVRGRPEEKNVSLDYLRQLHMAHEEWMDRNTNVPILIMDGNQEEMTHEYAKLAKEFLERGE